MHDREEPAGSRDIERLAMQKYFGIAVDDMVTYYNVLGISENVSDLEAINVAADARMTLLRTVQLSKTFGPVVSTLLNKVEKARYVLSDADQKKSYDELLHSRRNPSTIAGTTHAKVATALPDVAVEPPLAIPLKTDVSRRPAAAPAGVFQRYWKQTTTGLALVLAGTAGIAWLNASGESQDKAPSAAKEPKEPGKDSPALTRVSTDTKTQIEHTLPAPEQESPVETPVTETSPLPPAQSAFPPSAFAAAEPPAETPVTTPAEPAETLVAQLPPQAPAKPAFDKKEYDESRKTFVEAIKNKKDEQLDEVIGTYADNADIMKDDEMAKAVLVELFLRSSKTENLPRTFGIARRMFDRPELFDKGEAEYTVGRLKEMVAKSTDRMTVFSVYELLVSKGFMQRDEALAAKLAFYRKELRAGFRKEPVETQQQTAHEILTLARGWTDQEPETAEQLAREAKFAFPSTRENKQAKDAFNANVDEALQSIAQAKKFKEATAMIAADPRNAEALRVRGEIHMERGNVKEGLSDLSVSNHSTLAALARETEELRAKGASAGGTALLAAADKWKAEAPRANGKKPTFNRIESELLRLALAATTDPLHPLIKPQVQKRVNDSQSVPTATVAERKPVVTPSVAEAKKWMDGMPLISEENFVRGKWIVDAGTGQVKLTEKAANAAMRLPWKVKSEEFDVTIEVEFERIEGDESVNFYIPAGKGKEDAVLMLGGWQNRGGISGITKLDGAWADKNASSRPGSVIGGKGKHVVTLRQIQQNGETSLAAYSKGVKIYEFSCKTSSISAEKGWSMDSNAFGFGVGLSVVNVTAVRMQVHKGEIETEAK